ncbi:MAG: DUF4358 domain-containing protein [Oscillospiraceae bacterium]|nr:DUF4358 domain-containing protein [Oscillospiraceae bacterium]
MKKTVLLLVTFLLAAGLCACGQKSAAVPNMEERFESIQRAAADTQMLVVPPDKCLILYGIAKEDCTQELVAICQNSLRADEYWLIEAVDSAAADRIEAAAKAHLEQKLAELENYLPEQYLVVKQARLLRMENCVILLVSPQAEELARLFA